MRRIAPAAPCLFLVLLVLILFADVLFLPGDKVPSAIYGDVNHYFSTARAFGFREIQNGNFPLWDPHVFSGTPFVATFQSAMLYPPNLVYAVLPLAKAIGLDLALHVLLFGLFTCAWARARSIGPAGAAFAGAAAMFSGAFFYRVTAGHVTVIDGFAWMPLILLAVDKLIERPSLAWTMAGIFAVAMQILAGMPQVVFITFVTAGLLCVFQPMRWIKKPATLAAFASLGIFPVLLAAAQLFTSFQAMQYSKSHGGGSYDFSTAYSFPPANFLTLFSPHAYGDFIDPFYWGRWNSWEVTFFIGIGGLFLVVMALFRAPFRKNLPLYLLAGILIVLALGRYTPVYEPFFNWAPGFRLFRAPARMLVPASLILAIIAGEGIQALYTRPLKSILPPLIFIGLAAALAAVALYVNAQASMPPRQTTLVRLIEHLTSLPIRDHNLASVASNVRAELIRAACTALVFAFLLGVIKRFPRATALLAAAVAAEMSLFAFPAKSSFHLSELQLPRVVEAKQRLGSNRLHDDPAAINRLFNSGAFDIWGSDPLLQSRYAEFIVSVMGVKRSISHSGDPLFLFGGRVSAPLSLLRLAGLVDTSGAVSSVPSACVPLPQFSLITNVKVKPKNEVLAAINSPGFRPATEVFLESVPNPAPIPNPADATASGTLLEEGPGYCVLQFELPTPAILLNTDAYAPGWTVTPLEPSPQQAYEVMPADYAIRAIPLAAGRHKFRLEYVPPLFSLGKCVSIATVSLILAAGLLKLLAFRKPAHIRSTG